MSNPIITLEHINAGYQQKKVLSDVNLAVYEQDFLGIIGPNGGGKTTLIKIILGLHAPQDGIRTFYRNNQPCQEIRTGYLPQYSTIDKRFPISVREVVLSGLNREKSLFGRFKASHYEKVAHHMHLLELEELADRPIGQLSGGQLQRVLLARAIVSQPELLILDEPDTYIDKHFERKLYDLLENMNHHCSIILVSHDIGTVMQNVKNIACVNGAVDYHPADETSPERIEQLMGCPFELVGHGTLPHRILRNHPHSHTDQP